MTSHKKHQANFTRQTDFPEQQQQQQQQKSKHSLKKEWVFQKRKQYFYKINIICSDSATSIVQKVWRDPFLHVQSSVV